MAKELISIHWPGEKGRTSFRAKKGFKESLDKFLKHLHEKTGAKFSRNDFVIAAVTSYLKHLFTLPATQPIIAKMEAEGVIERINFDESKGGSNK